MLNEHMAGFKLTTGSTSTTAPSQNCCCQSWAIRKYRRAVEGAAWKNRGLR